MSTEFRKQFEEWAEESFGGDAKRFFVRCAPPHEDEYQHADVQSAWKAAQYFYARGAAGAVAWISVEERLPDNFIQVLVHVKPVPEGPDWYPRTDIFLGWHKRGIWFGSFVDPQTGKAENGEFPDGVITHWAALPSSPEEAKK